MTTNTSPGLMSSETSRTATMQPVFSRSSARESSQSGVPMTLSAPGPKTFHTPSARRSGSPFWFAGGRRFDGLNGCRAVRVTHCGDDISAVMGLATSANQVLKSTVWSSVRVSIGWAPPTRPIPLSERALPPHGRCGLPVVGRLVDVDQPHVDRVGVAHARPRGRVVKIAAISPYDCAFVCSIASSSEEMPTTGAIGPKVSCVTAIESGGTSSSTVGCQ